MTSTLLWALLTLQICLGAFDILYHHELTERLAWRSSQAKELRLHAARNLIYAGVFLVLGFAEPRGLFAVALLAILAVEVLITLADFVEEDASRRLPATERVTHALLALNYGGILVVLAPALLRLAGEPSSVALVSHGLWSVVAAAAAAGCALFALREAAAARRAPRLAPVPAATLARGFHGEGAVLVTGATGFIGRRLVETLHAADRPVIALVRDPQRAAGLVPARLVTSLDQISAEERIDAIVNLAGEPISDGFWTLRKRRRIVASRLRTTHAVRRLVERLKARPRVLVSGSAIGWYGLHEDEILDEAGGASACFSHRLCQAWEAAAMRMEPLGLRVVRLRIGLVLGIEGGLLSRLLVPFEFGLGGPIGSGRQWMSWIERDDLVRLILHAIGADSLEGAVNATAPRPVTNAEFTRALGEALHRPAILPAPAAPLRLALGDFADELLLGGQRVTPRKAVASGFHFLHADLGRTLQTLTGTPEPLAWRPYRTRRRTALRAG